MIVDAFLRWAKGANSSDRTRAAAALARAYLRPDMPALERQSAEIAMTWLLDDRSQRVRAALAEGLASSPQAPRSVVLTLAADHPEVACHVLTSSPLLTDRDLVDLAIRGSAATRIMIAARAELSRSVTAAFAEIGDEEEVLCLLENSGASLAPSSLHRIAERFPASTALRGLLLARADLAAHSRQLLAVQVQQAVLQLPLVQASLSASRRSEVATEALEAAACVAAADCREHDLPRLIDYMMQSGQLTPSCLMRALCTGTTEFFAAAIVALTGKDARRVRSIIANGRRHAVTALYGAAGLAPDVAAVFAEATFLWRRLSMTPRNSLATHVARNLTALFHQPQEPVGTVHELLEYVERLHLAEQRSWARQCASTRSLAAA